MTELETTLRQLKRATCPEDVFGMLPESDRKVAAKRRYRQLSLVTHEDRYSDDSDKATARDAFVVLQRWWDAAQAKIDAGLYGNRAAAVPSEAKPTVVRSKLRTYTVVKPLNGGDICDVYLVKYPQDGVMLRGIMKVARSGRDNDLVDHEMSVLTRLHGDDRIGELRSRVFPTPVEAFNVSAPKAAARRAEVLSVVGGYTMADIMRAYPHGLDPRDAIWMWKRALMVLGFAHANKIVHGAVLPQHILITPTDHGAALLDWSYATDAKVLRVPAISPAYRHYYAPEILEKREPRDSTDLYMLAKCVVDLTGGDAKTNHINDSLPKQMRAWLRACLLPGCGQRVLDAWQLHHEIDKTLTAMFGPRKFRTFTVPESIRPSAEE